MAVSIYHGILPLCSCLIINIAQTTHCDTESCMFPYLTLINRYVHILIVDIPKFLYRHDRDVILRVLHWHRREVKGHMSSQDRGCDGVR